MPHLKHDMDELFQKAAQNYPLNTGDGDWERVAGRLKDDPVAIKNAVTSGDSRKRYLVALLMLLIALLLTNIILIQKNGRITIGKNTEEKKESDQSSKEAPSAPPTIKNKANKTNSPLPSELGYSQNHRFDDFFPIPAITSEITATIESHYSPSLKTGNLFIEPIDGALLHLPSIKNRHAPVVAIKKTNGYAEEKRLYWGILAGPQISEVKQQGIRHADLDAGLLIGYRINKKLAIESGLFYGEKCYYSDAKYFKMPPDPSMPANMVLMDISGQSYVAGIPVKLRYDYINNKNNKFFATAGFSSYLLTKENNNYHSMVNGAENYMEKSYKENSCYAAANISVSAGFEHRIVKSHFIRIEPYLHLPVRGIGVGSMPVTSAGIHFGIITNKPKR